MEFLGEDGVTPTLAAIIVGENPASEVYVRNKRRRANESASKASCIDCQPTFPKTTCCD